MLFPIFDHFVIFPIFHFWSEFSIYISVLSGQTTLSSPLIPRWLSRRETFTLRLVAHFRWDEKKLSWFSPSISRLIFCLGPTEKRACWEPRSTGRCLASCPQSWTTGGCGGPSFSYRLAWKIRINEDKWGSSWTTGGSGGPSSSYRLANKDKWKQMPTIMDNLGNLGTHPPHDKWQ